jgi:energy-coupling factor transporter ATP-binding protein EcfA2
MTTAQQMYALSIDQTFNAIKNGGNHRTVLVQGHMGTGKSSLLRMLADALPTHTPCYFDCTTKDLGDITIPNIAKLDDGTGFVSYLTNEELGVHLNAPVILMLDEYGKANPAVKNAMLRLMLERKIGSYTLHPDSLVFATTNLGAEGVGDLLPPHARNRMTVLTMRKPEAMEWIEWGIENGIDHTLLGWCKDNPQLFHTFEDVDRPSDNPYIYHPREQRTAFVTPRSLEAASDWVKLRHTMDSQTLVSLLMGTIGERGALDLMAFVQLADQLPSLESIKNNPKSAVVPTSPSATCMVVYRALSLIDETWVDAWFTYLDRLESEAQGLFVNGIRPAKYNVKRRNAVVMAAGFGKWAQKFGWLYAAEKK